MLQPILWKVQQGKIIFCKVFLTSNNQPRVCTDYLWKFFWNIKTLDRENWIPKPEIWAFEGTDLSNFSKTQLVEHQSRSPMIMMNMMMTMMVMRMIDGDEDGGGDGDENSAGGASE